jgi:hypothetical protein
MFLQTYGNKPFFTYQIVTISKAKINYIFFVTMIYVFFIFVTLNGLNQKKTACTKSLLLMVYFSNQTKFFITD